MPKISCKDDQFELNLIKAALALKGYKADEDCKITWYGMQHNKDSVIITARVLPFEKVEDFELTVEVI